MSIPANWRDLFQLKLGSPGAMRAELSGLVAAGTKIATAGLMDEFVHDPDGFGPFPTPGLQMLLVGEFDEPIGVTTDIKTETYRFADVPWEFARDEGEGFTDIEDWRVQHRAFWEMNVQPTLRAGLRPDWALTDDTLVVCEWFTFEALPPEALDTVEA